MAFPGGATICNDCPDNQQLIKPSLTFNQDDLLLSVNTSLTNTPQDDTWLLSHSISSHFFRYNRKNINTSTKTPLPEKLKWYKRLPYFTILITFSEISSYILFTTYYKELYGLFVFDPLKSSQIWRYFTYMLLHSDICHLLMNITMQFMVAVPLEWYQGSVSIAVIYIFGIVFGSLGTFILQSGTKVIGSSAGTYALLLSHCADCYMNRSRKYVSLQIFAVSLILTIDICYIILHIYHYGNTSPKVGWSAHYVGALNGLLLGQILYKGKYKNSKCMRIFTILSCVIWFLLLTSVIALNIRRIHL